MGQLGNDEALVARRGAVDSSLASRESVLTEVWIVFYDAYGDFWVSGVFDSEDKATTWVAENDGPHRYGWEHNYRIEKYSVS
jgi:hypothetical protein